MPALISLLGITILFVLGVFGFFTDSFFGGEDFVTNGKALGAVAAVIRAHHLESARLIDLGSSRGSFISRLARIFPSMRVQGIDNSLFRTLLANMRTLFSKNVSISFGDIFKANISSANVVYVYLPQAAMEAVYAKMAKELKRGSLVITNSVNFPGKQALETYELERSKKLFVYQLA